MDRLCTEVEWQNEAAKAKKEIDTLKKKNKEQADDLEDKECNQLFLLESEGGLSNGGFKEKR